MKKYFLESKLKEQNRTIWSIVYVYSLQHYLSSNLPPILSQYRPLLFANI